ncbi:hypothetical protein M8494_01590 [Serratia ureilytica]
MSMPLSFTSAVSRWPRSLRPRRCRDGDGDGGAARGSTGKSGAGGLSLSEHAQCAESVEYAGRRYLSGDDGGGSAGCDAGAAIAGGGLCVGAVGQGCLFTQWPGAAGFNRLSDSALLGFGIDPASLHDAGSGFRAGIYSNDKQYVLAFAGTNDWRDWLSNVRQATGL